MKAENYYEDNKEITIPLDKDLTAMENAKRYYDKYSKLKRTAEALAGIVTEVADEIAHLESVMNALDIALSEDDLKEIKEELILSGYIRRKSSDKKVKYKSEPLHYISSDGYHMYVGKNNIQNEELTFKVSGSKPGFVIYHTNYSMAIQPKIGGIQAI